MQGLIQGPQEPLLEFIHRVETSLKWKFLWGPLRDQFKILVWDGMNGDSKLACAGMKECTMASWVLACKDIGMQAHKTQALPQP